MNVQISSASNFHFLKILECLLVELMIDQSLTFHKGLVKVLSLTKCYLNTLITQDLKSWNL